MRKTAQNSLLYCIREIQSTYNKANVDFTRVEAFFLLRECLKDLGLLETATTAPGSFLDLGTAIGSLVEQKNQAYGDAFGKAGKILEILYPDGVPPSRYTDMLCVVRVLDKLFRVATNKGALGETPWKDIAGYGLLGWRNDIRTIPDSDLPQDASSPASRLVPG